MLKLLRNLFTRTNFITAGLFLAPMTTCFYIRPQLDTIIFGTLLFALVYVTEAANHRYRMSREACWKLAESRRRQERQAEAERAACVD